MAWLFVKVKSNCAIYQGAARSGGGFAGRTGL